MVHLFLYLSIQAVLSLILLISFFFFGSLFFLLSTTYKGPDYGEVLEES